MPNLFGAAEPISITKKNYEDLIRDSERVNVLKRIVAKNKFISLKELKAVLGMVEEEPVPELKHPSVNLDDYAD